MISEAFLNELEVYYQQHEVNQSNGSSNIPSKLINAQKRFLLIEKNSARYSN